MCPACVASTAAVVTGSVMSTGGLAAIGLTDAGTGLTDILTSATSEAKVEVR